MLAVFVITSADIKKNLEYTYSGGGASFPPQNLKKGEKGGKKGKLEFFTPLYSGIPDLTPSPNRISDSKHTLTVGIKTQILEGRGVLGRAI